MSDARSGEEAQGTGPVRTEPHAWETLRQAVWEPADATPTWARPQGVDWPEPLPASEEPPPSTAELEVAAPDTAPEPPPETPSPVPTGPERPAAPTPVARSTVAVAAPAPAATRPPAPAGEDRRAGPAHKVVPRPEAPRSSPTRPSQQQYRIGALRRIRSSLTLLVLTAVVALVVAAVAVAVVAGIASAISSAASS